MDPRTQVAQGTAGTGGAYILQDKYDPAELVIGLGTIVAKQKLEKQNRALKNMEAFKTAIDKITIDPKFSMNVAEMEDTRDRGIDQLVSLSKQYGMGSVDDPSSPTGKYRNALESLLKEQSLMTGEIKRLYEEQITAYQNDPASYNGDEFRKRMEEFSKLRTMKEQLDFLSGKNNSLSPQEGFGAGLLVSDLDWRDPIEGIVASMAQTVIDKDGVATTSNLPDKAKIKKAVMANLISGQYDAYINKHSPRTKEGVDVNAYADKLTDYIYNQQETTYKRIEDKDRSGIEFNFGGGMGYESRNGITFAYGVEEGRVEGTQGFFPMDYGTVALSTKKGAMPPVFNYDFVNEETGLTETVKINPTKVVERNGRLYLQGSVAADVELATLDNSGLTLIESGGKDKKNKLTEIALDDKKGNDVKFAAQFGMTTDELRSNINQVKRSKEALREQKITQEVEKGVEDVKAKLKDKEATLTEKDVEMVANNLRSNSNNELKATAKGSSITVPGDSKVYNMDNAADRLLFDYKYGQKLK